MIAFIIATLILIVADLALVLAIYRQRQPTRHPAAAPPAKEPALIINDYRLRRGYHQHEATAAPAPSLAPSRPRVKPRSFIDRCSQAVTDGMDDARIAFQAYVPPGETRPAPIVGSRTLTFLLALDRSGDLERALSLDERMAMLAAVEQARVARYRGLIGIEFELPPGHWQDLALDKPGAGQHLRLGQSTLNRPARLDLGDASTAHALIAGTTGCGKTVLMRSILYQSVLASPEQQLLLLVDGKQELAVFDGVPHLVAPRITSADGALSALSWTAAEILRRGEPDAARTPLLVAIDELGLMVAQDKGAVRPLAQILSLGRSRNVHVVAGTQHVTAAVLGDPMIKANFTVRLAGQVVDAQSSALATGQSGLAANRLSGKGDFLAVVGAQTQRFTAACVSPAQLDGLARGPVIDRIGSASIEALAMIETVPPGPAAPTTPAQYATVLAAWTHAGAWPGIGKVAADLRVGKARAERIRAEAQELAGGLDQAGVNLTLRAIKE